MKTLTETVMPYNTGKSFTVKKGQRIRVSAESIVDFVPFNADNMRERFDQARTKAHNARIFISTGDKLYTKSANPMMTILEDTYKGKHDLQYGMCSKLAFDRFYEGIKAGDPTMVKNFAWLNVKKRSDLPDHGCWENMQDALKGYNVAPEDIPSPFNLFQTIDVVGRRGDMSWETDKFRPEAGKPTHMDLRAEMNCLIAISACPEFGLGKAIKVEVFDK